MIWKEEVLKRWQTGKHLHRRLIGARDLIIDSAPILAWHRADPDAAVGHAPAHHPRPLLRSYRVHTLICRGSSLPLLFLLSPANVHDAPFTRPLFFRLQRPPLCGWSALATRVALTYTASIVVGLAAQHAGRPDLIRSPKRVLAHT
jgi:hypothetical protein